MTPGGSPPPGSKKGKLMNQSERDDIRAFFEIPDNLALSDSEIDYLKDSMAWQMKIFRDQIDKFIGVLKKTYWKQFNIIKKDNDAKTVI